MEKKKNNIVPWKFCASEETQLSYIKQAHSIFTKLLCFWRKDLAEAIKFSLRQLQLEMDKMEHR